MNMAQFSITLIFRMTLVILSGVPSFVLADAHVDGFFREDFVKGGVFETHKDIVDSRRRQQGRETFFISREERRRNPEKAPSHSIVVERPTLRVTQLPLYPYPEIYLPGLGGVGYRY
jgi:hypothetical protein